MQSYSKVNSMKNYNSKLAKTRQRSQVGKERLVTITANMSSTRQIQIFVIWLSKKEGQKKNNFYILTV